MKYISLFSGIGGFEVAIHKKWRDAECICYSEVKESAIQVYEHHFPTHKNLGDISKLTTRKIKKLVKDSCDLLVGGFPCTNLTSMASLNKDNSGLEGKKSGLLYEMLRIIKAVKPKYIIAENNFSMKKSNRKVITNLFEKAMNEPIHMTMLNAADFGVQTRKRIFWINFKIKDDPKVCEQTWNDVLEPKENIQKYLSSEKMLSYMNKSYKNTSKPVKTWRVDLVNGKYIFTEFINKGKTRWENSWVSDSMDTQLRIPYPVGKSRPIIASEGGSNNVIIDRRYNVVRTLSEIERERLFRYTDNYTDVNLPKTKRNELLGNTVVVSVIEYILTNL